MAAAAAMHEQYRIVGRIAVDISSDRESFSGFKFNSLRFGHEQSRPIAPVNKEAGLSPPEVSNAGRLLTHQSVKLTGVLTGDLVDLIRRQSGELLFDIFI